MLRIWILFVMACGTVAIGATLLWSTPAWPAQNSGDHACMPLALAERVLERDHGERLFAVGQVGPRMMRFYVNHASRGWTALSVDARGLACVIGSGTDLDLVKPQPGSSSAGAPA